MKPSQKLHLPSAVSLNKMEIGAPSQSHHPTNQSALRKVLFSRKAFSQTFILTAFLLVKSNVALGQFTVSGNVFNDTNALQSEATVNGIGTNTAGTSQLYVNLINGSGNVTARATVSAGGGYTMSSISNGTYTLRLSVLQGTVSSAAPATVLHGNWQYTGENLGTGSGNDGTVNGILSITVSGANVTNARFGVQLPPYATSVTATFDVSKYGVGIPLKYLVSTDSSSGTVKSYKITTLPNSGSLVFRGSTVTLNQIITEEGGDSLSFTADSSFTGTVTFQYKPIDNANVEAISAGTYTMTLAAPFLCDGDLMFSRQTSPTSVLSKISFSNGTFDVSSNINSYTRLMNASGYYNGFVYIMRHNPTSNILYQLHPDNTLDSVVVTGLPTHGWNNATIDKNGIMYMLQGGTFNLYKFNLNTLTLTGPTACTGISIPTVGNVLWGDIAIDPITDSCYVWYHPTATTTSPVGMYKLNLSTGVFSVVGSGHSTTMGTLFFNDQGKLFGYGAATLGGSHDYLFTISTATGVATQFSTSDITTGQSDGCNCPHRPSLTLSVTTSVTKSYCGTASFNYTFGLRNPTGGSLSGLVIRDTLNSRLSWSFNVSTLQTTLQATFGGSVSVSVSSTGGGTDNVIAITGLTVPTGYNTFDASVITNGTFTNGETVAEQAYLTGMPSAYGALDYSDNPNTSQFKDTCVVTFTVTTTCGNLSGTVYNDANGRTDNSINGTGRNNPSGVQVYANLVNGSNIVVATTSVNSNGTYSFTDVANGTYTIQLSTNQGTVSSTAPAIALPTGWVNTAEGTTGSGDGTINGSQSVTVASSDVTGLNFGIQARPTAVAATASSQANPGGTTQVTVTSTLFAPIDSTGGTLDSIVITAFPSNATTIVINGTSYTSGSFPAAGVKVPTNSSGNPTQSITVDPVDGAVTVAIPYLTVDNAGFRSSASANINLPFHLLTVSGTLYNDMNGLVDGTVNGTAIDQPSMTTMYAYLVNGSGNIVAKDTLNSSNGNYSFSNAAYGNTAYTVLMTSQNVNVGATAPGTSNLPSGWVAVGESYGNSNGAGSGNEGPPPNCQIAVTTGSSNVTAVNFGIERINIAANKTYTNQDANAIYSNSGDGTYPKKLALSNASGTSNGAVNSSSSSVYPGKVSAADPEDGNYGGTSGTSGRRTFVLTSLPNSSNDVMVYYNGTEDIKLIPNPTNADPSWTYWNTTNSRYEITAFNASDLYVFSAINGHTSFSFQYAYLDSALQLGNAGTYSVSGFGPLPLQLLSFEHKTSGSQTTLKWTTTNEQNLDRYVLEKSTDLSSWISINEQAALNSGSVLNSYSFTDDIAIGNSYFRLRTVELDGSSNLSQVLTVSLGQAVGTSVYPNPASDKLYISLESQYNSVIRIIDATGKLVMSMDNKGQQTTELNMETLPAGCYHVQILTSGQLTVKPIVVVKN